MKNLKIYLAFGLSALFVLSACNKEEPTEDPGTGSGEDGSPVLTLSQTTLTVSAAGGVISVDYQVDNPVDGATVSVDLGNVTWITDFTVTDSTIELTVEANSESESRTATLTVSYPDAEDVSLTVVQEEVQYDYSHTLSKFNGTFYSDFGQAGEGMYYIWLSDIEFDNEGLVQAGENYYNFRIFVSESDGSSLPTGTYTATTSNSGDMVFSSSSRYVTWYETGYDHIFLTGGSITVSEDGGIYTIEGTVTDTNGAVHLISYTGSAEIQSVNVEFPATLAAASYYTDSGSYMNVNIEFSDMYYDGTSLYTPGFYMNLDTYMPYDADGKIAEGTYNADFLSNNICVYPYYASFMYNYKTTSDYTFGRILSGAMTVVAGSQEDYYTITCEFMTETGATVKCTYLGYLVVEGIPVIEDSTYSTLESDITLNLDGATVSVTNWGDWYGNGGTNLYLTFVPANGGAGDALQLDINTVSGSTFPLGTYTASATTTVDIGEYLYGYVTPLASGDFLSGRWYKGLDADGNIVDRAPLVDGEVTFTNNGNGTYTMEFEFKDDLGYTIDGSWTGSYPNSSSASTSTASSSKSSIISKLGKQEMRAKIAEMKAAQRESMVKVSKF